MPLEIEERVAPRPFTPPIKEKLAGTADRVTPQPRPPVLLQRQPGDVFWDFEDDAPTEADFAPYKEPSIYFEPFKPGIELQPFPRVQAVVSSVKGQWVCRCKAEEDVVRDYLAALTGGDPDKLKLSAEDKRKMADPEQRTDCETCQFQSLGGYAWNAHKAAWQHK